MFPPKVNWVGVMGTVQSQSGASTMRYDCRDDSGVAVGVGVAVAGVVGIGVGMGVGLGVTSTSFSTGYFTSKSKTHSVEYII